MIHKQNHTVFILLSEVQTTFQTYTDNLLAALKNERTPANQIKQVELALNGFRSVLDTTQGIIDGQINKEPLQ